jgi:hypothetical protein
LGTVVKSIVGVFVFVTASFLELYLRLHTWILIVLSAQIIAVFWIWHTLYSNNESAKQCVKAHLLAIRNIGIVPASTPVYQKLFLYEVSLYVTAAAFMAFLTLNMLMSLMHVEKWVSELLNNTVQLLTIGGLMLLYRPRGKKIDDFLQPDTEGGQQQRSEIALEELETFEVEEGVRECRNGKRE